MSVQHQCFYLNLVSYILVKCFVRNVTVYNVIIKFKQLDKTVNLINSGRVATINEDICLEKHIVANMRKTSAKYHDVIVQVETNELQYKKTNMARIIIFNNFHHPWTKMKLFLNRIVLYCIMRPYTDGRLDR